MTLLDISLPGINGYEVCRYSRQRQKHRHPVIIAITGYRQQHDRERALAASFDEHFVKPVGMQALLRAIRQRTLVS